MNSRQISKRNKQLKKAIKELNNDVSIDNNFDFITDEKLNETFDRVVECPKATKETLETYKMLKRSRRLND